MGCRTYQAAGSPRAALKWLKSEQENILAHFKCMTEPPVWYQKIGVNNWPFHDGWPMIFFGQFPSILEGNNNISGPISIMVFGYKERDEKTGGFYLRLTTLHQDMDSDGESIEDHYRKEARRMRYKERREAQKQQENKSE